MAGIASGIFNTIFRRNVVFLGTVFVGAFAFEMAWEKATDTIWDTINKGRQWKDIKHKYIQHAEDDE